MINEQIYGDMQLFWVGGVLIVLLVILAFFSVSETSLMSLNTYKLKHLAKTNQRAKLVSKLLKRPDRLLGLILIGNTFATVAASSVATSVGIQLFGDSALITTIIAVILTTIMLIFAEILPKTLGALMARRISMLVAWPLQYAMWLLFPLTWLANFVANSILRCFGVKVHKNQETLSMDELRTVVTEASGLVSDRHKIMLASILDLETLTVDDIMIPRTDIIGIDLDSEPKVIRDILNKSQHTLLPVYRGELENVVGIVHMRDVTKFITDKSIDLSSLASVYQKPYFVPEGTSLHQQLINFQQSKKRAALIVDEYGDILGLVTVADILEEIVGEFTTDVATNNREIKLQADGSYVVDGGVNIRALNRTIGLELPTEEAKTLSGLIIEYLEAIPEVNTGVSIAGCHLEVVSVQDKMIKVVRIYMPETNNSFSGN